MANLHLGSLLKCDSCIWNYHSQWESDPLIWDPNIPVSSFIFHSWIFLRYVCVSCLIENSILVVLCNQPSIFVQTIHNWMCRPPKVAICLLLVFQNLKPFEVTETPKHLQRPKNESQVTPWHLLAYGFLTTNANLICRGGILVSGKSLGVFLLGSGAEGCFRGGETEPKNVSTFEQCLCCIFSRWWWCILFKGVCFGLFSFRMMEVTNKRWNTFYVLYVYNMYWPG